MKKGIIRFKFEIGRGFGEYVVAAIPSAIGAGIFAWVLLLVILAIEKSGMRAMDSMAL